jgi:hypothetical protein
MEEFSVVIMKWFRPNWFEKTKGRHVTYNTRQSVLKRKRIYASFVKSKIPKIFEVEPKQILMDTKNIKSSTVAIK